VERAVHAGMVMSESPRVSASPAPVVYPHWWELLLIVVVASAALFGIVFFYDNVHRATTNGLWKSIDVTPWVERSPTRWTDGDNLLYYPVVAALVRLLPADTFGAVWQRMAFVNALFGAAVLALTYTIALRLFHSRVTSLFACVAQFAMAFFVLLSTINEDIMPGYAWFVAAVACVVLPRQLTPRAVVLAAQCVALSWLFHSSLRLPGVIALVCGIAAAERTVPRIAARVGLFCLALVPLPIICALAYGLTWRTALWSAKGLGTGWGGFTANKIVLMWSGIAQSVHGGQNVASIDQIISYPLAARTTVTTLILAVLFAVWLVQGFRRRAATEWRIAVAVLAAAFVFGEAMNLYIQPQDPQMQIQPMTWLPFAAACVFAMTARLGIAGIGVRIGLAALMVLLFKSNLDAYVPTRHADSAAVQSVRALEAIAPPDKTMFLLQGFEGMASWLSVEWRRGQEYLDPASPPPAHYPGFNAVYISSELVLFSGRSAGQSADNLALMVDVAMELGYDVVATDVWAFSEEAFVDSYATVSSPDKARAVHAALHRRFTGMPIGSVPGWGTLYRITRKAP
jgi:hypothetical protein